MKGKWLPKQRGRQRSGISTIKYRTWPGYQIGKWQKHKKTQLTREPTSAKRSGYWKNKLIKLILSSWYDTKIPAFATSWKPIFVLHDFVCDHQIRRSANPSHWDGSFEYPQHMLWFRNKKNILLLFTVNWMLWLSFNISSQPLVTADIFNILSRPHSRTGVFTSQHSVMVSILLEIIENSFPATM